MLSQQHLHSGCQHMITFLRCKAPKPEQIVVFNALSLLVMAWLHELLSRNCASFSDICWIEMQMFFVFCEELEGCPSFLAA